MAGNYAVMVDAGFLMAEGAKVLGNPRQALAFDGAACVQWCGGFHRDATHERFADIFGRASFLRAYWYDAAYDPSDHRFRAQRAQLDALAMVPGLYLRLGHLQVVRPSWQRHVRKAVRACGVDLAVFERHFEFRSESTQKGVDSLMTLDLVNLARDRAVDAILLVSGDRDLEEPVRVAQGVGCKVVLAYPPRAGVATTLRQLVDAQLQIDTADLQRMLVAVAAPDPVARSA
ncbi:MAG TPA: NYN domain-containing protein [Candidatus Dormibacteraeota bacterium]